MKFSVLFAFVAFIAIQLEYIEGSEFVCEEDMEYMENECNSCLCTGNSELACTMKACSGPRYEKLKNCKVGDSYVKDHCNNVCWCVKDLGTICENEKCDN